MRRPLILIVVAAVTAGCAGWSEDDALADVREFVVSDQFGNMSDEELSHFMRDMCREVDDDGMYAIQEMWVGFAFSAGDAGSYRDDVILMMGNATKTFCPDHQDEFDDYKDGNWTERFDQIHEE